MLPNPEEILDKWYTPLYPIGDIARIAIVEAMKEYGRQVRDKTLEWANSSAQICGYEDAREWVEGILEGKTHKDLDI